MERLAREQDVVYTRYADDLYFSSRRRDVLSAFPGEVHRIVGDLALPGNLVVNDTKTFHSSRKGRRVVTGLVLTPDGGVSIGRARKRYIRHLVHHFEELGEAERKQLQGWIAFAVGIEPDFANRLVLKYGDARYNQATGKA